MRGCPDYEAVSLTPPTAGRPGEAVVRIFFPEAPRIEQKYRHLIDCPVSIIESPRGFSVYAPSTFGYFEHLILREARMAILAELYK